MHKNILCLFILLSLCLQGIAQSFTPNYFDAMQWRMIGPYRGGRTVGAVGVPQQPNVFYIGVNNGGVWKTTDYGRTWLPIFDDQPTGSIGDVAVANSNPDIIYVASGEGIQRPDLSVGDGIYKSIDAGKTWTNKGLQAAQQIGGLAINPNNYNIVFVAALGHPYGANTERGVYRTTDGGDTWERVLYIDENTGAIQVTIDPNNSNIIFADMYAGRLAPWENGAWNGKESGLYKSIDGGSTWKKMTKGLPTTEQGLGRIGFCIAPSDSKRMYAVVDAGAAGGVYRSDDAGESWRRIQTDERYWGRGSDFAEIKVDPKNADIVYDANVVTWKSIDGGMSWKAFRGAPGGDDYHRVWINPYKPEIILIASDQGAAITVNGGETFSSWYNQPTAQFYHVSTDNAFPYNVYGGQQESGSVGIASRGNDGGITFREWHPVGAEEYGYIAADPHDPNIIYGGKISRFDKRTGQVQNISPEAVRSGKYRFLRTAPILFSPVDKQTLYYAGNVLFKTLNGGKSWQVISPDLSREQWDIPNNIGIYTNEEMKKMKRRGVIYTVAPSQFDIKTIWCGTDDGLIHITTDGGLHWKNITPASVTSWSKISMIDASHFDKQTAYVAVNRIRCDDQHPHIYKTNDFGKTWKEITNGLPNDPINVVREDPVSKGLLYAGSERAVYVSFDDGENWQSLRLNMPATSIRDLVIKDDDIVVGTHGRSFWILDNISTLRQLNKSITSGLDILYKPQTAFRVRWDMYTDTPLPQEEPAGQNPPDGAMMDYYLQDARSDVKLEIFDAQHHLIRTYTNMDTLYTIPAGNVPEYWIRPQQILSAQKGAHRFLWDMHYQPLNETATYSIGATYRNTAPEATSPWVMPGKYEAVLTVDGQKYTQTFSIKMDPRVTTSLQDLQKQHDLSLRCYRNKIKCMEMEEELNKLRVQHLRAKVNEQELDKIFRFLIDRSNSNDKTNLKELKEADFHSVMNSFTTLLEMMQQSDRPITTQVEKEFVETEKKMEVLVSTWDVLKKIF